MEGIEIQWGKNVQRTGVKSAVGLGGGRHDKTNGWWQQSGRIVTTRFVGKGKDNLVLVRQFCWKRKGTGG